MIFGLVMIVLGIVLAGAGGSLTRDEPGLGGLVTFLGVLIAGFGAYLAVS